MNGPRSVKSEPIRGRAGLRSFADTSKGAMPSTLDSGQEHVSNPPKKTFFRGVAVGLAIMIPLWLWLALRIFH